MNSTLEIIRTRYSCRSFTDQAPTAEQLQAVTQAAIQAPSGMNRQNWQVILVKNRQLMEEMAQEGGAVLRKMDEGMYQHIMSRSGNLFYNAPCMILFAIKQCDPPGGELIDLGIIAQTAVLAAASLGLDTLHCGFAGLAFAGDKAADFKARLRFPEGYECGMAVLLGHATAPTAPHQPDPGKITVID